MPIGPAANESENVGAINRRYRTVYTRSIHNGTRDLAIVQIPTLADVNLKADKTALAALETTVNGKANQAALDGLSATVDTKADKTAATTSAAGLMSAEDKARFDGLLPGFAAKTYYIDPAGDTSANTPGDAARPFKTIMTAVRALNGKQNTGNGNFHLLVGASSIDDEPLSFAAPMLTNGSIIISPWDPLTIPVVAFTRVNIERQCRLAFRGVQIIVTAEDGLPAGTASITCGFGMRTTFDNCQFNLGGSGPCFSAWESGVFEFFNGNLISTMQPARETLFTLFQNSALYPGNAVLTLQGFSQFTATAINAYNQGTVEGGAFQLNYPAGITGQRYSCLDRSAIKTGGRGQYFFPGSADGAVDSTSIYM